MMKVLPMIPNADAFQIPIDKLGYPGISGSLIATFSESQRTGGYKTGIKNRFSRCKTMILFTHLTKR